MAIKIKKNGVVQDLVINANEVRVLDTDGNFRSKNLESVLKEINTTGGGEGMLKEADYVFATDIEPDYDGVWLDTSEDCTGAVEGDNGIVKAIRDYIDTDVKATVEKSKKLVQENNKIVKDIQTNVGNRLDVVPQLSGQNLLINGDFQVWQRGTIFKEVNKYTADRWKATRNRGIPNVVKHSKGLSLFTDTQTARASIMQPLEDSLVQKLKGKTVTLSAKVFADIESVCGISIDINTGTLGEYKVNVSNVGSILTKTFNIPSDVTSIAVSVHNRCGVANQNIVIEYVKLEQGTVATPFVPRPYAEELALCKRYFEIIKRDYRGVTMSGADGRFTFQIPFLVEKRIKPTITKPSDLTNTIEVISISDTTPTILSTDSTETGVRIFGFIDKTYALKNLSTTWGFRLDCDSEIY